MNKYFTNNVKNILSHQYSWIENNFIILILINVVGFLALKIFVNNSEISSIVATMITLMSFIFGASNSLIPHANIIGNKFSWKFYQSLPIKKSELVIAMLLSSVLSLVPFFLSSVLFWSYSLPAFNGGNNIVDLNMPKITINIILISLLFAFVAIAGIIAFPRIEFQRKNQSNQFLRVLKIFLIFIVSIYYVVVIHGFFKLWLEHDYFLDGFILFYKFISSWWFPPVFALFLIYKYKKIIKSMLDEYPTYKKINYNSKKDWTTIAVCCFLFAVPVYFSYGKIPKRYEASPLLTAIYKNDYKEIELQLKNNQDINLTSNLGFTPMLTAIREKNLPMVKFLESKGANFSGVISNKNMNDIRDGANALSIAIMNNDFPTAEYILSRGFDVNQVNLTNGISPLSLAANYCNSKIIDLMINNGAKLDAKNLKGEEPILVAAKANCFTGVVSMTEAGALFNLEDKKIFEKENNKANLVYFIEKHSRKPASK